MIDPDDLLADTPDWKHRRADDRLPPPVTPAEVKSQRDSFILLVALVIVLVAILYVQFFHEAAPAGVHVEAAPAPQVAKVPTVALPVKQVQAYAPAAKQKLNLPERVQQNKNQHVVAATRTPADERPYTVTTVLDTETGTFTTFDRAEPLPWVAASTRRHFGAYIGQMNGEQAIAITARQEVLRIKGVKVEGIAIGSISQAEHFTFVGVGASW